MTVPPNESQETKCLDDDLKELKKKAFQYLLSNRYLVDPFDKGECASSFMDYGYEVLGEHDYHHSPEKYKILDEAVDEYPRFCFNYSLSIDEWNRNCRDYKWGDIFEVVDTRATVDGTTGFFVYVSPGGQEHFTNIIPDNKFSIEDAKNFIVYKPRIDTHAPIGFVNYESMVHFVQRIQHIGDPIKNVVSESEGYYVPVNMFAVDGCQVDTEKLRNRNFKIEPAYFKMDGEDNMVGYFPDDIGFRFNLKTGDWCLYSRDSFDGLCDITKYVCMKYESWEDTDECVKSECVIEV